MFDVMKQRNEFQTPDNNNCNENERCQFSRKLFYRNTLTHFHVHSKNNNHNNGLLWIHVMLWSQPFCIKWSERARKSERKKRENVSKLCPNTKMNEMNKKIKREWHLALTFINGNGSVPKLKVERHFGYQCNLTMYINRLW